MIKGIISFAAVFLAISLPADFALAQIYDTSISAATAGAGRAAVDTGEPSFLNPAILMHLRGNHFLFSRGQQDFAVYFSDNNRDIVFPAALAFVQRTFGDVKSSVLQDVRLTIADRLGDQWAFGINIHHYQIRNDDGSFGEINGDIGLLYTPTPDWGLAYVTYEILGGKEEIPTGHRLSRQTALAANYLYGKIMRFRADILSAPNNNFSQTKTMFGYEIYLNEFILARVGYQDDRYNDVRQASVGIGFDLPKFDINYAYVRQVPQNIQEQHSIDFALSF